MKAVRWFVLVSWLALFVLYATEVRSWRLFQLPNGKITVQADTKEEAQQLLDIQMEIMQTMRDELDERAETIDVLLGKLNGRTKLECNLI